MGVLYPLFCAAPGGAKFTGSLELACRRADNLLGADGRGLVLMLFSHS
jgi:hypothetical protein